MISEVWANGRKHRSFIKGIGNETAVQLAYASATAARYESVLFEFSDASGMSYRTTDKLGAEVATGDGGEGSPIETDPLGGSVGTSTPYSDPFAYVPDPEFPDLIPYNHGGPNIPGQDFASLYATFGSRIADLPGFGTNWGSFLALDEHLYEESVWNATHGAGFNPNEYYGGPPGARLLGFTLQYGNGEGPDGYWTTYEGAASNREGDEAIVPVWDETEGIGDEWISVPLPVNFRDLIRERLNATQPGETQTCNDFLKKIMAQATAIENRIRSELNKNSESKSPEFKPDAASGIDAVNGIKLFTLQDTVMAGNQGAGGTVQGTISGGNAQVLIASKGYYSPVAKGFNPVRMWTNWYIGTAIHEITHLAGRGTFSDGRLALAAYELGYLKEQPKDVDSQDQWTILDHSDSFEGVRARFCGSR